MGVFVLGELIDHLQPVDPDQVILRDELLINNGVCGDPLQPTPMGRINLRNDDIIPPMLV